MRILLSFVQCVYEKPDEAPSVAFALPDAELSWCLGQDEGTEDAKMGCDSLRVENWDFAL